MSNQFSLATAAELRPDLLQGGKAQRAALTLTVANMTVNNHQMLGLLPEVLHCMRQPDIETKRLCCLFLETYTKLRPQQANEVIQQLIRETGADHSPESRALALRTLGSVAGKADVATVLACIAQALTEDNAYLRKVACVAVTKMWSVDSSATESSGVLQKVNSMLARERDPSVLGNVVQTLLSITETATGMHFVVDFAVSLRLAKLLDSAPDFSRVALLKGLMQFIPATSDEAEQLSALLQPSLRHINAAVVLGATRVLMMLSHYSSTLQSSTPRLLLPYLLALLVRQPEIQYCVLKNIHLLLQSLDLEQVKRLRIGHQPFLLHASDPAYIRLTKIDVLVDLCTNEADARPVLRELLAYAGPAHSWKRATTPAQRSGNYSPNYTRNRSGSRSGSRSGFGLPRSSRANSLTRSLSFKSSNANEPDSPTPSSPPKHTEESDTPSRRRAVAGIGRLGASFEPVALEALNMLAEYVPEPEALVAIVQLVRRHPLNAAVRSAASEALAVIDDVPTDDNAASAYLWFLSSFAHDHPKTCASVLAKLVENMDSLSDARVLALLAACMRVFLSLQQPQHEQTLVIALQISAAASQRSPDVRDRALFYQRLLTSVPRAQLAKFLLSPAPEISSTQPRLARRELEDLELSIGYLSSIFLRPGDQLFRVAKPRQLHPSAAILPQQSSEPTAQPKRPVMLQRQSTLTDQFQGLGVSSPEPLQDIEEGDVSERLIDL